MSTRVSDAPQDIWDEIDAELAKWVARATEGVDDWVPVPAEVNPLEPEPTKTRRPINDEFGLDLEYEEP